MKTETEGPVFQLLPRDSGNVNLWGTMLNHYYCIKKSIRAPENRHKAKEMRPMHPFYDGRKSKRKRLHGSYVTSN